MSKTEVNYKELALDMLKVAYKRQKRDPETVPELTDVYIEHDKNMTLAVLSVDRGAKLFLGWSKFNPADKTMSMCQTKRGGFYFNVKSCYSADAGARKAIHRAIKKILG